MKRRCAFLLLYNLVICQIAERTSA